ncbi:1490_t:CDS:2, partial [Gigaspora margarita]
MQDNTTSGSSAGTIGARDNQETEEPTLDIEPKTKSYIDSAIQAATMTIMQQMQQFVTQQAETQREWNAQVLESINQKLAHREPANINESGQSKSSYNNAQSDDNQQRTPTSGNDNGAAQAVNNETVSYKATGRKFPSLVYTFKDDTWEIQGFINGKAIVTEQIRLWWVTNWSEGQKKIEMLPKKPSLPNKIWKTIALGLFADLQEFAQKNLMNNVKAMNEDTVLQTSEDRV